MWLTKVFDLTVERRPIPRPNGKAYLPFTEKRNNIVLHSMENLPKYQVKMGIRQYRFDNWTPQEEHNGFEIALDVLRDAHSAPHFSVGDGRIVQHREIGIQGAALTSKGRNENRFAFIQIEASGNTEGRKGLWQFTPLTYKPLVKLFAHLHKAFNIPLVVPANWPDDMEDCPLPWAVERNKRRLSGVWIRGEAGVYYHLEVPSNSHFDCALQRRTELLNDSLEMAGEPVIAPSPIPNPFPTGQPLIGKFDQTTVRLQRLLLSAGILLPRFGADGIWGNESLSGLITFQTKTGLPATGKVDDKTWQALIS